jgi:hypothetical protein
MPQATRSRPDARRYVVVAVERAQARADARLPPLVLA